VPGLAIKQQSSKRLASAAIGGGASVSSTQYNKQQDDRKMKTLFKHQSRKANKHIRIQYENNHKTKR
jgi:hypothetical protein